MALAQRVESYITREEYLEGEKIADAKHEYIRGEVYALAGASVAHGRISRNLLVALDRHTDSGPCEAFASDMKVQVDAADAYYYPDVVVVCDDPAPASSHVLTRPKVIIEVLSPSTEDIDRSRKFTHYRTIPTLTDYLLVAQDRMHIEHFHREDASTWTLRIVSEGGHLTLSNLAFECRIEDVYKKVRFDEPEEGESEDGDKNAEAKA